MYADIGQHPAPMKSNINTHLLDDNRVDYAELDHSVHKHKVLASPPIKKSGRYVALHKGSSTFGVINYANY